MMKTGCMGRACLVDRSGSTSDLQQAVTGSCCNSMCKQQQERKGEAAGIATLFDGVRKYRADAFGTQTVDAERFAVAAAFRGRSLVRTID